MEETLMTIIAALIKKYCNNEAVLSPPDMDEVENSYMDSEFDGDILVLKVKEKN